VRMRPVRWMVEVLATRGNTSLPPDIAGFAVPSSLPTVQPVGVAPSAPVNGAPAPARTSSAGAGNWSPPTLEISAVTLPIGVDFNTSEVLPASSAKSAGAAAGSSG
jgi:hypothetical protein